MDGRRRHAPAPGYIREHAHCSMSVEGSQWLGQDIESSPMMGRTRIFTDRAAAGIALAQELQGRLLPQPLLVLALPRGGVAVGYEVAHILQAPLDVMLVRKIGLPGQPELAMGAVACGGIVVRDAAIEKAFPDLVEGFDVAVAQQRAELERREKLFRAGLPPLQLTGKTVVLVDDGIATGSTMLAALRAARRAGAARVVAAAPVASSQATALVRAETDAIVILQTPPALLAVGEWYRDFEQLEDAQVCRLLDRSHRTAWRPAAGDGARA